MCSQLSSNNSQSIIISSLSSYSDEFCYLPKFAHGNTAVVLLMSWYQRVFVPYRKRVDNLWANLHVWQLALSGKRM